MKRQRERGFTLYEFLVSTLVVSVALVATMLVTNQMGSQLHAERGRVAGGDNSRVALDEVTRVLRAAGSQTDQSRGQDRFVYAGPWTLGLNANLFPLDDEDPTAEPAALDPELENGSVTLDGSTAYTPPRAFGTGAETIVLSVDSDRDGELGSADGADDEEEESHTPHDLVLKMFVYGSDGTANVQTTTGIALLRGPAADVDGIVPQPLFRYWLDDDNDPETAPVLHGDADADGTLSQSEVAGLTPVASDQLALIAKVDVTTTTEGETPKKHSEWGIMTSSVTFRNFQSTSARVTGMVYNDSDEDGAVDPGEVPLAGVLIRCSNGRAAKTGADGRYNFLLPPGTYSLTEIDRVGYRSTTPNTVAIEPIPGDYVEVNFGDVSIAGTGFIHGLVYHDRKKDGVFDAGEDWGMQGVRVFLDTGAAMLTDTLGTFLFALTPGNYTVTEVDSLGYASSTPNIRDVTVASDGDSVYVTFGDYPLGASGDIQGIVYYDADADGVLDRQEIGIANVTITLDDRDVTQTDASGNFRFVASVGSHEVTETDPPAHSSSTLNTVTVDVVESQTVYVEFGDIPQQDVSFQEIILAQTERALSIAAGNLREDNKADLDMVLGTHYVGGTNDILVWWNARQNASTPNTALFTTTPTYQRVVAADVNALVAQDLNADGAVDLASGLGTAANNVAIWLTQTGKDAGQPPTAPTAWYTASGAQTVNDLIMGNFDSDAIPDFAIATTTGYGTGRVEIWVGRGGCAFVREDDDIYSSVLVWDSDSGFLVTEAMGEVVSLAKSDFNGDGIDDLVVGARQSTSVSLVYVLVYGAGIQTGPTPEPGQGPGPGPGPIAIPLPEFETLQDYAPVARLTAYGAVQDVLAVDMKEDDRRDTDIFIAGSMSSTTGYVQLWHNEGSYNSGTSGRASDQVDPVGAPLCMTTTSVDNDIYPDLVVGTRDSDTYGGQVQVYRCYGFLPTSGTVISSTTVGEIVTMTAADFNQDGAPDLSTGTRTSPSTGKVVVFFNTRQGI